MEEFQEVVDLLNEEMDVDHPRDLRKQLTRLEAWRWRVCSTLRSSQRRLNELNSLNLLAKEKGLTELDREAHRDFKNKDQIELVEHLKDMVDCIDRRISLGQTFLTGLREEVKKGL